MVFDEQFDANDLVQFSDKLKESLDAAGKTVDYNHRILYKTIRDDRPSLAMMHL